MLEGRWEGHYERHDGSAADGSLVKFTAVLRDQWFWRFSGTIEEDPVAGVPETSSVSGWWKGRTISFEKRYSRFWTRNDAGAVVPLDDWVKEKHNSSVVVPFPYSHAAITYAGILNDSDGSVMGTWHLPSVHGSLASGGSILLPEAFGTFAMRRLVERTYRPQRRG